MMKFKDILQEAEGPFIDEIDAALHNNLTPGIISTPFSKVWINRMTKIAAMFRDMFENHKNNVAVWRVVFSEDAEHIKMNGKTGMPSWTFNSKVVPYLISVLNITGREGKRPFILRGHVSMNEVDWEKTLSSYMLFSRGYKSKEREDELRLKKGVVPKDIDVIEWTR